MVTYSDRNASMLEIIFIIVIIFLSVIVHEISHGYTAYWLGDPTAKMSGRLTLNPLKHLDPLGSIILPVLLYFFSLPVIGWAKPVPFNPYNLKAGKWGPAIVAASGPLSNILIAIFFAILIRLNIFGSISFTSLSIVVVQLNLFLAIFNLVPIPPLDGSKVLFAFFTYKQKKIEDFLERYGLFFIIFFLFYGLDVLLPIERFFEKLLVGA